jgi:hypothetical protein
LLVGALDVDLDERPGELLLLPRRGGLARAQPDDHIPPADRLAGTQGDVLDDPVVLVEDPEDRNALAHRGHAGLVHARRCRRIADHRRRRIVLVRRLAAGGEREDQEQRSGLALQTCFGHAYSGIHGW